jgi:hypothetical protein
MSRLGKPPLPIQEKYGWLCHPCAECDARRQSTGAHPITNPLPRSSTRRRRANGGRWKFDPGAGAGGRWMRPESQVRSRLAGGGRGIRTLGPPRDRDNGSPFDRSGTSPCCGRVNEIRIRKCCPACFAFARRGRPLLGHPANAGDIVRQDIGPLLSLGPARGDHHGDLGDAELPRGENPGVARDQATVLAHQRRRRPAPLLDARSRLSRRPEHPCGSGHFWHTGSADRSPSARPCRPATAFDFRRHLALVPLIDRPA